MASPAGDRARVDAEEEGERPARAEGAEGDDREPRRKRRRRGRVIRLKLAADMGATRVVNVANTPLKEVMADLHMEGFDVGLEMSGNPRAFNDMLDCMYHGGKIAMLVALRHPELVDRLCVVDISPAATTSSAPASTAARAWP